MPFSRWDQLAELLETVAELAPEDRDIYLDSACEGDNDLKQEVLSLLESEEKSEEYLERLNQWVIQPAFSAVLTDYDHLLGKQFGSFRLDKRVGQGGMGYVYLATRIDGDFEQEVAVKVVRQDPSPVTRARFFRERRILAKLTHPGIAQIYDGGVTDEGLLWLAMDYVEGKPITQYADDNKLTVSERLNLFREVCEVVTYAHRNLIIHKDLKPSNIFVTDDGRVKLLDFGIAHVIQGDEDGTVTQFNERAMTPEYAAPEQVRGESVTIGTDIYALGILLYELLTGRRPFRVKGMSPIDAQRILLENDPIRPSTAITKKSNDSDSITASAIGELRRENVDSLRKRLRGDLDVIVLKALRKEPEQRYSTVEAFSQDIRNYLYGLPVTARSSTFAYRANRFIRRNRWQVGAVALIVILLIGGLFAALTQANRANRAAERAQEEYIHAEAVTQFMIDLFHTASPLHATGGVVTANDMLETGLEQARRDFADNPRMLGNVLNIIGSIYVGQAEYEPAEEILTDALELYEKAFTEPTPELHQVYLNLGALYYHTGKIEKADSFFTVALPIGEQILNPLDRHLINNYNSLGMIRQHMQEFSAADSFLTIAAGRVLEADGNESDLYSTILHNLSMVRRSAGDPEGALEAGNEALELSGRLMDADNVTRGLIMLNLAQVHYQMGSMSEAESMAFDALEIIREVWGISHPATLATLRAYSMSLIALDKFSTAERVLLDVHEQVAQDVRADVYVKELLVTLYDEWDRPEEAARYQE